VAIFGNSSDRNRESALAYKIANKTRFVEVQAANGQGSLKKAIEKLEIKWRLLLPGASEPRLTELNPSGL
jgi:hypothetical protein